MRRVATAWLLLLGLVGCGDSRDADELPVWKPENHAHPPSSQVDPSRVPGRDRARGQRGDAGGSAGDTTQRAAAALWRVSCSGCHADDGSGGGPQLPQGTEVPDLTDPEWQRSRSDEEIAKAIAEGPGTMPAFGDKLASHGLDALVAHVRGLGSETGGGGDDSESGDDRESTPTARTGASR